MLRGTTVKWEKKLERGWGGGRSASPPMHTSQGVHCRCPTWVCCCCCCCPCRCSGLLRARFELLLMLLLVVVVVVLVRAGEATVK